MASKVGRCEILFSYWMAKINVMKKSAKIAQHVLIKACPVVSLSGRSVLAGRSLSDLGWGVGGGGGLSCLGPGSGGGHVKGDLSLETISSF